MLSPVYENPGYYPYSGDIGNIVELLGKEKLKVIRKIDNPFPANL